MNAVLYAIPSFGCNLSCSHCHIKNQPDDYNEEKFKHALKTFKGRKVLFGGEPLLKYERSRDILDFLLEENDKFSSISTNLLILKADTISLLKEIGSIATSWNPNRFTDYQEEAWKSNFDILAHEGLEAMVMITLTDDLFDLQIKDLVSFLNTLNPKAVSTIHFEHYIGNDSDEAYYDRADEWLTEFYLYVQENTFNHSINIIHRLKHWIMDCDEVYTLMPNGTLINACPQGVDLERQFVEACLTCSKVSDCMPCRFHKKCSFPNKLNQAVIGPCGPVGNES